jgi:crotonobetainyl-CoA:carnitine CoA-transferase CaiB-like acyl-CoA transferase
MGGPLTGTKVVELGFWVAGPAAGGILADWGAEVVKIEPFNGDPMRGLMAPYGIDVNPPFETDNRGKRSICLDLATPKGRELAQRLVDDADVFVTNLRGPAVRSQGLDYASCSARNPRLVYVSITGYGLDGPHADRAAYDIGAFWSRSGVAHALSRPGEPPVMQRGGMGDHMTGLAGAAGVAAALLARERTGQGQLVSTSLMRIGGYMMSWDVSMSLRVGVPTVPSDRLAPPNPILNPYRTADDRWLWLLCLQADRHWPDVVRAVERPDLLDDGRFASIADRQVNGAALVEILDKLFASRTLSEWAEALDREGVWWEPVQGADQLAADPQADGARLFVDVPSADGDVRMVSTPIDFSATRWAPTTMAPELGQHTEDVLLELGLGWDEIAALADDGVIP